MTDHSASLPLGVVAQLLSKALAPLGGMQLPNPSLGQLVVELTQLGSSGQQHTNRGWDAFNGMWEERTW